ncbi:MAG: tetratricopeptide repeat protein [Gammaproteobacteria bacterium]|nr:tetratricopeptide repeat protein [Gammaproteobacteria bacterium]
MVRQGLGIAALLLTLSLLPSGCAGDDPNEPVVPSMEGADRDLMGLIDDLLAAVRAAPDSGDLRGRLAMAYDVNGFDPAAIATYRQAQSLDPSEFDWPYLRALLLAKRADFEDALAALDEALAIDADYAPAWLWRGAWLLEMSLYDEARAAYERATELEPKSPAAAGIAQSLLREERFAEAISILEPVADQIPHPHVQRMLGEAYRAVGRTQDARIAMARGRVGHVIQWTDPRVARKAEYVGGFGRRLIRGQDLIKANLPHKALEIIKPLQAWKPDDEGLISNLSWAYKAAGETEKAVEVLEHGIEVHPKQFRFHLALADVYRDAGDDGRMKYHIDRALEGDPTNGWAHEQLARIAMQEQRYDDALASFDIALQHGIDNQVEVLYTAGAVEGSRERWPQCIERFQRLVDVDVSIAKGHIGLGLCLAEVGRFEEARGAFAWAERIGTQPDALAQAYRQLAAIEARDD